MAEPSALVLSIIGFGASVGALAALLVIVLLIRLFAARVVGRPAPAARAATPPPRPATPAPDPDARNRARAAAIAVTALLEANPRSKDRS